MNQIPNIEEEGKLIDAAATDQWPRRFLSRGTELGLGDLSMMVGVVSEIIQAQLQKAREEERERIILLVEDYYKNDYDDGIRASTIAESVKEISYHSELDQPTDMKLT